MARQHIATSRGAAAANSYCAYGLTIASELELPELVACRFRSPADLTVRVGPVAPPPGSAPGDEAVFGTADEAWVSVPSVAVLHIARGRAITLMPEPNIAADVLRLFLLGGALGLALHQRGVLTLHASVVALGGGAAFFLGDSGAGKSTIAAALHAQGFQLVADDVAAVLPGPHGRLGVLPGYPRLKLWPDSARAIGGAAAHLEPLRPGLAKGQVPTRTGFTTRLLPIHAVYLLEDAPRIQIDILPLREAFGAVSAYGYAAALLGAAATTAAHLQLLAALAEAVPVFALGRPRQLAALPVVAAAVAGHYIQLTGAVDDR